MATTLTGSPCKKCKKKGDLCHLHGGTPRKESKKWRAQYLKEEKEFIENWRRYQGNDQWYTPLRKDIPFMSYEEWLEELKDFPSPKKSPKSPKSPESPKKSKKSPESKGIRDWSELLGSFFPEPITALDKFNELPKPVMMNIMLKLERNVLHLLCSESRKAKKICDEPRFKEEYNKIHYILFSGKLKLTEKRGKILRFADERDNILVITLDVEENIVFQILYIPRNQKLYIPKEYLDAELSKIVRDEPAGLILDEKGYFNIGGWITDEELDLDVNLNDMAFYFLESIGAEDWYNEENNFWFLSTENANDFIDRVENATKRLMPELDYGDLKYQVNIR